MYNVEAMCMKRIHFLILSFIFMAISLSLLQTGPRDFFSFFTNSYSADILTTGVPDEKAVIMDYFAGTIGIYMRELIAPLIFLLLSIFSLAKGLAFHSKAMPDPSALVESRQKERCFVAALFLITLAAAVIINFCVLQNFPFTGDEYSYLFQADLLSGGKLYTASPPIPCFFKGDNIICNGKWFSKYSIGWPLLLAPGVMLGIEFLITPLFAALTAVMMYFLAARLFGKDAAVMASLLLVLSPFFLFTGATYYPHTATGFFLLLMIYSLIEARESNSRRYSILAGTSLACIFLIRNADAAAVLAGVMIFYFLWKEKSADRKAMFSSLFLFFIPVVAAVAVILGVNTFQTGNPFLSAYSVFNAGEKLGFGPNGHTPLKGVWNVGFSLIRNDLWVAPVISILGIISLIRKDEKAWLLFLMAAGIPLLYIAWYQTGNIEFGSRFMYLFSLVMIPVASSSLLWGREILANRFPELAKTFFPAFLACSFIFIAAGTVPVIISRTKPTYLIRKAMMNYINEPEQLGNRTLILLKKLPNTQVLSYFLRNWKQYEEKQALVAVWLTPGENEKLVKLFPKREAFVVDYDPKTSVVDFIPFTCMEEEPSAYVDAATNYDHSLMDRGQAISVLEQGYKKFPCNPQIAYPLTSYYFSRKEYAKAIKILEETLENYRDPSLFLALARCYMEAGDRATAIEAFTFIIENFPDHQASLEARQWLRFMK